MEKLTAISNFGRAVDALRTTECSSKDKLNHFQQIAECIKSPAMQSHASYSRSCSNAIGVLLLFCEDLDSFVRMNAEENLNKVLRALESTRLSRILIDLYNEIKKNGNQRSLRITLNLFGHYCPRIKEKNVRWYAVKLIPCLQAISTRKETLVLEALCEFIKTFSKTLQIALTDSETHKLLSTFLTQITLDCAVKRRCASQNCIGLIENARNSTLMAKQGLNVAVDTLHKEHSNPTTIVGVFGFLRLLLPLIINDAKVKDFTQILEVYDLAVHELYVSSASNHSVVNASLEVINAILQSTSLAAGGRRELAGILCNHQLGHNEYLRKRKSLKNQIFQLKNVEMTCHESGLPVRTRRIGDELQITPEKKCKTMPMRQPRKDAFKLGKDVASPMEIEVNNAFVEGTGADIDDEDGFTTLLEINEPHDNDSHLSVLVHAAEDEAAAASGDDIDKSQFLSDIDNESFNSIDFESEITIGERERASPRTAAAAETSSPHSNSRAKSSDTIGSFFNNLLSHSNSDTMTKLFRPSSAAVSAAASSATAMEATTPSKASSASDADMLSLGSVSVSSHSPDESHVAGAGSQSEDLAVKNEQDLASDDIQIEYEAEDDDVSASGSGSGTPTAPTAILLDNNTAESASARDNGHNEPNPTPKSIASCFKFNIGTIYEQTVVYYTARCAAAKFLLAGQPGALQSDADTRISIKSLSLSVIANCVRLMPEVLSLPLGVGRQPLLSEAETHVSEEEDSFEEVVASNRNSPLVDEMSFLEIKDDHFGESTSGAYLSVSANPVLVAGDRNHSHMTPGDKLSKSDIIESNTKKPPQRPTPKPITQFALAGAGSDLEPQKSKPPQSISDILLFHSHSDPVLRGNVQVIIGNFIYAMFGPATYVDVCSGSGSGSGSCSSLHIDRLLLILIKGLQDEIHTVVINALSAFAKAFPVVVSKCLAAGVITRTATNSAFPFKADNNDELLIEGLLANNGIDDIVNRAISPKILLQQLRMCFHNKYWLVLNKYAEVISNLDYNAIRQCCGHDAGAAYETIFLDELLLLVGDDDFRVREHTANSLCRYISQMHPLRIDGDETCATNFSQMRDFLDYRIFRSMSTPLRELFVTSLPTTSTTSTIARIETEQLLAKVLYRMTNKLMSLNDRNLQFGIIYAVKVLLRAFNSVDYNDAWKEFNFAEICLDYTSNNLDVAVDVAVQGDILEVVATLVAANVLSDSANINSYNQCIDNLFTHVMKLLNIYFHLFGNQKPILFGKPQKSDLFANAKELAAINAIGYFGNENVYIKVYAVLRSAFDSYQITINHESGSKLMSLLRTCLHTLSLCIELKARTDNPARFIEEVLQYLRVLINYAAIESIGCLRQMLRYIFERNYANRPSDYGNLTKLYFNLSANRMTMRSSHSGIATIVVEDGKMANESKPESARESESEPESSSDLKAKLNNANDSQIFAELFGCAMDFPLGKSRNEEECARNIKLFEPLVIYCLTLFMKSNASVQAPILDLLSQLLELNVTYSILDSKCVIFEQVSKNLELIEAGSCRNCDVLIPSILTFLVKLTSQTDKKLITIPKIISIANNLLANNSIKDLSVLALQVLVYELFFQPLSECEAALNTSSSAEAPSSPNPVMTPTTALNAIELNTQKEVVLGMLEKFIDSAECQRMFAILLLWFNNGGAMLTGADSGSHPDMSSMQKDAIFSIVRRALCDGRIHVASWQQFFVLDAIFKNSDESVRLGNKEFYSMLSVFMDRDAETFNNLSHAVIILDNVILKTEEINLENHVKVYLGNQSWAEAEAADTSQADFGQQTGCNQASSTPSPPRRAGPRPAGTQVEAAAAATTRKLNEINYFCKVLCEKLDRCFATLRQSPSDGNYSGLAVRFVRGLFDVVSKMAALNCAMCSTLAENAFWDKHQLTDGISNHDYLRVEIFQLFISMNLFDKVSIMRKMQTDAIKSTLRRTLLAIISAKYHNPETWSSDEIEALFSRSFLNNLITDHFAFVQALVKVDAFGPLLARSLIDNSDIVELTQIPRIVKLLESSPSTSGSGPIHVELQVELLSTMFKKCERRRALQRLIERALRKIIANEDDKSAIENIFVNLPERNPPLENLLFEGPLLQRKNDEHFHNNYKQKIIDEKWIISQIIQLSSQRNADQFVKILFDIKSELKLQKIFAASDFDLGNVLGPAVDVAFKTMMASFRNDCVQYTPHINYLTMNPLAKVALSVLMTSCESFGGSGSLAAVPTVVISLMENVKKLEEIGLVYIEARHIDKFVRDHILKQEYIAILLKFMSVACNLAKSNVRGASASVASVSPLPLTSKVCTYTYIKCIDAILKQKHIWMELNQPENDDRYLNEILDTVFVAMTTSIRNTIFYKRCKVQRQPLPTSPSRHQMAPDTTTANNFDATSNESANDNEDNGIGIKSQAVTRPEPQSGHEPSPETERKADDVWLKALFVGNVIEEQIDIDGDASQRDPLLIWESAAGDYASQMESLKGKPPTIPLEQLSDVDALRKFVRRLSIFGFTSRQQFEEYFMTFLLLINKVYDENMVDVQEQYQIKRICLDAIFELLITSQSFPIVGNQLSRFHHTTRWSRIKCDSISLKKLHKVHLLVPEPNAFYHPNLERDLSASTADDIIGTHNFQCNQYDLNFIWHQMEEYSTTATTAADAGAGGDGNGDRGSGRDREARKEDVFVKNFRYFAEASGIDFKSCSQLIFDVLAQLIEQNHMLVLPSLVKFCEICDSRDQIKWIRDRVQRLQESTPIDDTISHQHIIFLLCKTQSMLIPSPGELSQLCAHISTYLKSSHVFIRNAALNGLLCLLECCCKTNTAIGKLGEELSMLRDVIVAYISRHGVIDESSISYSDTHTKLVWTLNFSLIEWTTKFVPDCHLLSNTIISANNFLKRTTNEDLYLCILHGLERVIMTDVAPPVMRSKIEKLALELVKLENEKFSMPALKLMLSCMYMGSSKQLENTELSNGIVQDDPEIIAQQTDKVDILLHCIKSSTKRAAWTQGQVLCQIIQDLVPPNEILTKVIKEFLAVNQPHCDVIARIVFQVFRSAIDSSFLQMLQDWLICSLPTFLSQPSEKGVWLLTIIFLSASINLHLIKLFPAVLDDCAKLGQQEISIFVTSAQDFHSKLSAEQKQRFVETFGKYQQTAVYRIMLASL